MQVLSTNWADRACAVPVNYSLLSSYLGWQMHETACKQYVCSFVNELFRTLLLSHVNNAGNNFSQGWIIIAQCKFILLTYDIGMILLQNLYSIVYHFFN